MLVIYGASEKSRVMYSNQSEGSRIKKLSMSGDFFTFLLCNESIMEAYFMELWEISQYLDIISVSGSVAIIAKNNSSRIVNSWIDTFFLARKFLNYMLGIKYLHFASLDILIYNYSISLMDAPQGETRKLDPLYDLIMDPDLAKNQWPAALDRIH